MKNLTAMAFIASAGMASAGNINYVEGPNQVVVPPVQIMAEPENPFDGFYIGLSAKALGGDTSFIYDLGGRYEEEVATDMTGGGYGIYAGFGNVFNNGLYLGVEANAQMFESSDRVLVHRGCYLGSAALGSIDNIRGRVGFQTGRALVYAHGGYSVAEVSASVSWTDGSNAQTSNGIVDGIAYGAGIEYAVTDNLIARLEYTVNDLGDFSFEAFRRDHTASFAGQEILVGIAWQF